MGRDYFSEQMGIQNVSSSAKVIEIFACTNTSIYCSFIVIKLHRHVHSCLDMELSTTMLQKHEFYRHYFNACLADSLCRD